MLVQRAVVKNCCGIGRVSRGEDTQAQEGVWLQKLSDAQTEGELSD